MLLTLEDQTLTAFWLEKRCLQSSEKALQAAGMEWWCGAIGCSANGARILGFGGLDEIDIWRIVCNAPAGFLTWYKEEESFLYRAKRLKLLLEASNQEQRSSIHVYGGSSLCPPTGTAGIYSICKIHRKVVDQKKWSIGYYKWSACYLFGRPAGKICSAGPTSNGHNSFI